MAKTENELAFLRGIYIEREWTQKFTDLFDENIVVEGLDTITYVNAGVGTHSIELRDKLGPDVEVFPVCEDAELALIAKAKADVTKCEIDFSTIAPFERSDMVIADASLVRPRDLDRFLAEALERSAGRFVFFLPTSGSFGEIFSYLWEVLFELDLPGRGAEVEELVAELKTVSEVEELVRGLDLRKVEWMTKKEILEFETGRDLVDSPLINDFFFPAWLDFLDENEKERVREGLAQKIDDDRNDMSFQFSLKATLISGVRG